MNKPDVEMPMHIPYDLMRRLSELPNLPGETLGDKICRVLEDGIKLRERWAALDSADRA